MVTEKKEKQKTDTDTHADVQTTKYTEWTTQNW